MLNPQHLAIFAAIVQAGSISRAAVQLRCGKSLVSRQLARLEQDLGARLIQRSTRRLALTEIGELVLREAQQIARALDNIGQLADQHQHQVRGVLRVSCSMAGRRRMVPLLAEFTARYPQVKVTLRLEEHLVDLIAEQIDVAIRAAPLADSSLIARKLSDNASVIVAAPSYLARAGTPHTAQDLRDHACLVYANGDYVADQWVFIGADGPYTVRVTAAAAGLGILRVPRALAEEEMARGELVQVLAHCELPPGAPLYAVFPARDFLAMKTSAFVDFLLEKIGGKAAPQ